MLSNNPGCGASAEVYNEIFANESMGAMKYKQRCRHNDMPVKLTFQSLKEITNNFANKLGCGASAEVYKGVFNGEVIAVKKMPFKSWIDQKQFQNEYEHLMRLKHHNIGRLVAFCDETEHVEVEYEGQTIIAEEIHRALCLEFLPHGSLSEHIREKYPGLNWSTRFQIIMGMCAGLKYIHEVSVVHLDIKPDNILLDAKMKPKIADFRISRLLSEECMREANVTLLGTIGYIPPEFIDNQVISREFDVFSLGVTIKKIVTEAMDYWNISYMNDEECIEHHPFWSMHTSGRPELVGPAAIAEYELDPLFKDLNLDMSVYWYLLPFIGHKVASAADAPNSSGQVGTTTGYRQSDFRKFHSDVPGEKQRAPDRADQDGEEERDMEKKAWLPSPPFQKQHTLPRVERSLDQRYTPCPPLSKEYYSGKIDHLLRFLRHFPLPLPFWDIGICRTSQFSFGSSHTPPVSGLHMQMQ